MIILCDQHARTKEAMKKAELSRFYLEHMEGVNNWDLIDTSAAEMVGSHLDGSARCLRAWSLRRSCGIGGFAIVSTFAELRADRTAMTFWVAERLLGDKHDLIHKAVGWLLREAGKRSQEELLEFLRTHYDLLPRTTLRYAIEPLVVLDRKQWLAGPC